MQIRTEQVASFHVFMEVQDVKHIRVEIVFSTPGGGIARVELPPPFGCMVSAFFLGCLETAKRIQRVPSALRGMVSHAEAIKMLSEAAWPSNDAGSSDTENHLH